MESRKEDWVDFKKIKEAVGFADVLESLGLLGGMELEGKELVGLCPLHEVHDKKKRSFYVNVGKGTFHCFACKKSGNVLDFVRLYQNVGLKEAGKYLEKVLGKKEIKESLEVDPPAVSSPAPAAVDPEKVDPSKDPPGESATSEKLLAEILAVLKRIEKKISWLPSK